MSTKTGFISNSGTPFAYLQDSNNASIAMGLDAAGSDVFKISVSTGANAVPTTSPQLMIDPAANGDISLQPNGLGDINLVSSAITTTGGILQADITTGRISIASSGTGITTLDGNSGSATGATVTIETANSTPVFVGSGATLTLDFGPGVDQNFCLI